MRNEDTGPSQAELSAKAAKWQQIPKFNLSVIEAAHAAGVGRSSIYLAISSGELKSFRIGRRRLVAVDALRDWLASKGATS